MRLKEDNSSWKSGGIKRRMYRQAPLLPEQETYKGHPKRKQKKTKKPGPPRCKHVWVQVSHKEYSRYRSRPWLPWWIIEEDEAERYWEAYHEYFVCAGCLATKDKVNKGKMNYYYWKRRRGR